VLVALLTAGWGLLASTSANRRVTRANELAARANSIADSALQRADASNAIALAANSLSEEANEYGKRSIAQKQEDSFVTWELEWQREASTLVLVHRGRDVAVRPSDVTLSEHRHLVVYSEVDVAADETFLIVLDDVAEKREQQEQADKELMRDNVSGGVFIIPAGFRERIELTVRWKSVLGTPDSQILVSAIY